jgi:ribulose bisphosphate carboxylase small subunit
MKATVLTLALLCAGAAYAQSPPPAPAHGPDAARHMEDLATLLDLTDAQKAQVQAILQEQHAKMKQSFEQAKASGTRPDWQQMKALHEQMQQETLQKLAPVLSATQLKKFQIIQQEMAHAHMGHHMGHGEPGASTTPPAQN